MLFFHYNILLLLLFDILLLNQSLQGHSSVFLPQEHEFLVNVKGESIETEEALDVEVYLGEVRLPLVVLVAQRLIEHLPDLHYYVQVLVCQDVTQVYHCVVADYPSEVHLLPISLDSHYRGEDQREERVDHGHRWQPRAVPAYVPASLVIVLLAGIGDMPDHPIIKLIGEVVD